MNCIKLFSVLVLLLSSGFNPKDRDRHLNPKGSEPHLTKWVIDSGCSLKVAGTTNVSKFNCTILDYARPDTLTFYRSSNAKAVKVTGVIAVDVQRFDCRHAMITRDLRKTLKSAEFPKLVIRFISLGRYPEFDGQTQAIKGLVAIELAGVTREYEVDYKFTPDGTRSLTLIGSRRVNFSDFNLAPPRKAAGMIKTNNALDVEFNLQLKVI